jgi:excisionase family DNA binding protein
MSTTPQSTEGSPATPDPEIMTAQEVATLLRVNKSWVYAQARANRIPHIRLGRYVRFRRSAINEWLDEIEQEPASGRGWRP